MVGLPFCALSLPLQLSTVNLSAVKQSTCQPVFCFPLCDNLFPSTLTLHNLIAKGQHKENITGKRQTSKLKRKKIFARGKTKGQRGKLIAKGPHKEKIRRKAQSSHKSMIREESILIEKLKRKIEVKDLNRARIWTGDACHARQWPYHLATMSREKKSCWKCRWISTITFNLCSHESKRSHE